MRVTNSLLYSSSIQNQQTSLKKLYDIDKQISSGMKIQDSFENSGIYVDTMRLNYEIATLEQVKETSSKAKTFSQNTDTTMNQFTEAISQFKTKLVQASNTVNSSTSLGAIADELQGLRDHMVSLGNTSINGQFIFSGSSLLQKPLESDGTYKGNSDSLNAIIGSGVELPYNINGQSLFLGLDSDYNKVVSTNITMYNQSKLNPNLMTTVTSNTASSKVYLSDSDTIRDMIGDTNNVSTDDPNAVFYLSGRKSDGSTFSTVIETNTSSKVSSLLENIGSAYGNTASNKVVDVSLNVNGQIEVKDLKPGSQLLEMNIFGAIDRSATAGATGNAKQILNVDNLLVAPNVDIIAFNKSNFTTSLSSPDLSMRSVPTSTAGQFALNFPINDVATTNIELTTSLVGLFPSDVNHLMVNGVRYPVAPNSILGQTVNDLITAIGGTTSLVNGQIRTDLDISIIPYNASNVLAQGDALPDAMNYARRGFEKNDNILTSNISQTIKSTSEFATSSTKLIDVAGVSSLNGKQLVFDFTDIHGTERKGTLNLDINDTTFSIDLDNDGNVTDENETFSIYNGKRDTNSITTKADEMTYQQLMDVISMVTSGSFPKKGVSTTAQTAITNAVTAGTPPANAVTLATETATAKIGVSTKTADYIQQAIDFGIAQAVALAVPDAVAAAKALASYNEAITNANLEEYNHYANRAKNDIDVSLDYRGRINILDKNNSESKIEFTMFDKSATDFSGVGNSALSFMANDAITVEGPRIDFFKDLDEMIEAVRKGIYRMDDTSTNSRNIGMQNSIAKLDHLLDHVTKEQTQIGAYTNALSNANDRAQYLSLNVKTVKTEIIGVDVAEAYLQFNQLSNSYQAMLSTISKINSMSLLNYM